MFEMHHFQIFSGGQAVRGFRFPTPKILFRIQMILGLASLENMQPFWLKTFWLKLCWLQQFSRQLLCFQLHFRINIFMYCLIAISNSPAHAFVLALASGARCWPFAVGLDKNMWNGSYSKDDWSTWRSLRRGRKEIRSMSSAQRRVVEAGNYVKPQSNVQEVRIHPAWLW